MSKSPAVPSTYEPQKPLLPCPTSPIQQTDSETWEHTRTYHGDPSYDRYVNDHISDRVSGSSDGD